MTETQVWVIIGLLGIGPACGILVFLWAILSTVLDKYAGR